MTRRAFVIGHPIAHSRSPLIHMSWIRHYGLDATYEAVDIAPEHLPGFFDKVRGGSFVGGNVTIPHKEAVFALCDMISDQARLIGAANTLIVGQKDDQTSLFGTNTDGMGFSANLDAHAPGWDESLNHSLVLGAGGAARAILVALAERGAKTIHVLNRSAQRAHDLTRELGPKLPAKLVPGTLDQFIHLAPQADLLVNTSAIGMHNSRFENLDLALLPKKALVTDIVYTPLQTPLLIEAKALGLKTVDGLGMLLHQAVPGFEAWFGVRPEVTADLRALVEADMELT